MSLEITHRFLKTIWPWKWLQLKCDEIIGASFLSHTSSFDYLGTRSSFAWKYPTSALIFSLVHGNACDPVCCGPCTRAYGQTWARVFSFLQTSKTGSTQCLTFEISLLIKEVFFSSSSLSILSNRSEKSISLKRTLFKISPYTSPNPMCPLTNESCDTTWIQQIAELWWGLWYRKQRKASNWKASQTQ